MHAAIKLFQVFAPQGAIQGAQPQKIAIKLQAKGEMPGEGNAIDFNALLASLLPGTANATTQDQVESTLEKLNWLPLDQSLMDQSTPVIDLTNPEADNEAALQMLMTLALNLVAPNEPVGIENQGQPGNPVFTDLLQSCDWTATSDKAAAEDASLVLLQKEKLPKKEGQPVLDFRNSEGEAGNDRTTPGFKAISGDGAQKETSGNPAELSQELDGRQKDTVEALTEKGTGPAVSSPNGAKNTKPGRTTPNDPSLFGLKASPSTAEQSMAPSENESDTVGENRKSLERSLISQNRFRAESSPGQEGALEPEKSQDAQDIRLTAHHAARAQAVIPSKAKDEPAQLPRDMQTDVIRQIVARMTLRGDSGRPEMQIKLKPEFLGDLRMHVITENQHVMVRITADSPAVKEMIEQNLQFLKSELQQHGLQIDKFDVFVGQENEAWKQRQQQNASHDARRGRQRYSSQKKLDALEEPETHRVSGLMRGPSQMGAKEVDFFA